MRKFLLLPIIAIWLLFVTGITLASLGDRQTKFRACLSSCAQSRMCQLEQKVLSLDAIKDDQQLTAIANLNRPSQQGRKTQARPGNDDYVSWDLRLFGWGCEDQCKYECMHAIADERKRQSLPVWKYYGKWSFLRLSGIQEPASVLFSLMNLYVHWWAYRIAVPRQVPRESQLFQLLRALALVQVNAWLCSTVFHCRDLPLTEKMDYFSAILNLIFGLYVVCMRMINSQWRFVRRLIAIILFSYFIGHCMYLSSLERFDYTYNIVAGVVVGAIHNLIWLFWCLRHLKSRKYARLGLFCLIAVNFAMLLELYDFDPVWQVFDAHSLWHLSTVPLGYLWTRFLIADAVQYHENFMKDKFKL